MVPCAGGGWCADFGREGGAESPIPQRPRPVGRGEHKVKAGEGRGVPLAPGRLTPTVLVRICMCVCVFWGSLGVTVSFLQLGAGWEVQGAVLAGSVLGAACARQGDVGLAWCVGVPVSSRGAVEWAGV